MAAVKEVKKTEIGLHFRIPAEVHEELRRLSFNTRTPIAQLCREGIELILKKYAKEIKK